MQLLTKKITEMAHKQYPKGSDFDQMVVAKFFDAFGSWSWYLMNIDPADDDYCWGIVKGFEVEMGSFLMSELKSLKVKPCEQGNLVLRIERDLYFKPTKAKVIWDKLLAGEHV